MSFTNLKSSVSGFHLVLPVTYVVPSGLFMRYISSWPSIPDTLFQVCLMSASRVFLHHSPSVFLKQVLSWNLKFTVELSWWPASPRGLPDSTSPPPRAGTTVNCMPGVQFIFLFFVMGSGNQIHILTACKANAPPPAISPAPRHVVFNMKMRIRPHTLYFV